MRLKCVDLAVGVCVAARIYQFAGFRLNCGSFELRRNGTALRVERMPMELLILLVSRQGELVSRDEIGRHLWSSDVFVDTEHGINTAIRKVRYALRDDPENPRILQTVKGKGYRIVCPIEMLDECAAPQATSSSFGTCVDLQVASKSTEALVSAETHPPASHPIRRKNTTTGVVFALLAAIFLLTAGWYLSRPLPPPHITGYSQLTHDGHYKNVGGTDGARIYFIQFPLNVIEVIGLNGGEVATSPVSLPPGSDGLMDISPDGSNVLIGAGAARTPNGTIWVAPALGGPPRQVGLGEGESFSPDGSSIIYHDLNGDIFVARIDGSERRKLASTGSHDHFRSTASPDSPNFRWSPNGSKIRFDKDGLLWEMAGDGSGLHRLLPDWKEPGAQCCGVWTPDGRFYLFQVANSATRSELWALDERHGLFRTAPSVPVRLTEGVTVWRQPIPGRDGKKIFIDGVHPRGELTRIDPRTGTAQAFVGGASIEQVSFSPDSQSMAYSLFPEGSLWKADRDGSHLEPLSVSKDQAAQLPRWSPDSKQILFTAVSHDLHLSLFRISADGGSAEKLVPDNLDTSDGTWSPDGTRIVFARGSLHPGHGAHGLRILDLGTNKETALPGGEVRWSPRWSTDGRYIAALHEWTDDLELFDCAAQKWTTLEANGGQNHIQWPAFAPDGRYVYYFRSAPKQGVFRVRVTGGKEERVLDMAKWRLTGFWGMSMTLDPSGAPLVLRDIGSDDIYALTLEP